MLARIIADQMRGTLGQTVVIENVTGASGTVAGQRVARSEPDGYTITIGHWGTHVLNGAIYQLQYDVVKDFEPIALIASGSQLIIAKPEMPAQNLKELVAWLKANPSKTTPERPGGIGGACRGHIFQNLTGTVLLRAVSWRRPSAQ